MAKKQSTIVGHSMVLTDFINNNNIRIFAEIGVWKGGTTKRILRGTHLVEYWAVDPWLIMSDGSRVQKSRNQDQWDSYHLYCCRLMWYFPQLKIVRSTSRLAVSMFPPDYFDLIYIDARHECEFVDEDIGLWIPKVRPGGFLAGHDYGGKWPGVKKAVDSWFDPDSLRIWEIDEIWMVQV